MRAALVRLVVLLAVVAAGAAGGFAAVEVLPVPNDFFRLYRLHA